jgi:glycosyltransferase involved in cell wall biosynthesis
MMRLALISEHASPLAALGGADAGGQNVYVAETARLLAERGHDVTVFTRRTDGSARETVTLGHRLRVVHVTAGPARDVPKERLFPYMPRFADEMSRYFSREGLPDLVHAHFWMSGMVASDLKRRFGVPFAITFHALGRVRRIYQGEADGFPPERGDIEQSLMDEAARVVAECPQDVADMTSLYRVAPRTLVQVPCGFDRTELSPVDRLVAREALGLPRDAFIALQLGRMVPRKGVDDAIRGFARATAQSPHPTLLLVVGGSRPDGSVTDDGEGARLLSIALQEGADSRVRFLGRRRRDELRHLYSAADVFISVPWYEPFGITPVEAMACGVPVIGARVGGVKHTVVDGETGLLVEPKDPEAVARALRTLFGNRSLREQMGRAGIRRANSLFTWERVTDSLERVYRSILIETAEAQPATAAAQRTGLPA